MSDPTSGPELPTTVTGGQSSGPVPAFDLSLLARGSYFITRPSLFHYVAARGDLLDAARALFDVVLSRAVKVEVRQTYPLAEAAEVIVPLLGGVGKAAAA